MIVFEPRTAALQGIIGRIRSNIPCYSLTDNSPLELPFHTAQASPTLTDLQESSPAPQVFASSTMSSKHDDEVTAMLKVRCASYEATLTNCTPSIGLMASVCLLGHLDTLQSKHISQAQLDALNQMHTSLEDHWSKTHAIYLDHALLLGQMFNFQKYLAEQLLSDYGRTPFNIAKERWVQDQAALIKQHRTSVDGDEGKALQDRESGQEGDDDDGVEEEEVVGKEEQDYEKLIVYPVNELLFDLENMQNILVAAAEEPEQKGEGQSPGPRICALIERCDWPSLAATLVKDRLLLQGLQKLREDKKTRRNTNRRPPCSRLCLTSPTNAGQVLC